MLVLHCVYAVSPWSVVHVPPQSEPVELCLLKKTPVIARTLHWEIAHHRGKALQGLCNPADDFVLGL